MLHLFVTQEGSYQAQSNLKFLLTLKDPCHDLAEAHPKDIPNMLPKILNLIRMIWVNSEFYTTRERLTGILRKVGSYRGHGRGHTGVSEKTLSP